MAQRCTENVKSMGIEHHVLKIPWSEDGFPEKPSTAFEGDARIARFRILFDAMTKANATVLALGHHEDDQVETSIMRILKGSTADGAAGMKHCRRWGMDRQLQEYEGMKRWVVRPLLTFPKDRLLATCEAEKLDYVVDATNFQPGITIRNAIRHWLSNDGKQTEDDKHLFDVPVFQNRLDALGIDVNLSAGVDKIYHAVSAFAFQSDDIDHEVDQTLSRNTLRSPPGTYLIPHNTLACIENPKVQRALVLRILRYISNHPWGSLAAQSKRRSHSLLLLVEKLWGSNHFTPSFTVGAGVVWRPVAMKGYGFRIIRRGFYGLQDGEQFGWIATRINPPSSEKQGPPLWVDITRLIASKFIAGESSCQILYDNRFFITFNLTLLPSRIEEVIRSSRGEIMLAPDSDWFHPHVVLRRPDRNDVIFHSVVQSPKDLVLFPNTDAREVDKWPKISPMGFIAPVPSPWVTAEFIRPLTSM
ncbi:PP-loop family-domain-containing protein [Rhodocollybia butyracea]|uniref:tRNA(Ile)-lysidine synthetase n=1 Tax=Rhodocollybia butyracea TaxID=206335 RepID=A0A9P5U7V1_9AGAR|nr:PP-loop family-domain-containing protein [Rhodocollybia butyracea]